LYILPITKRKRRRKMSKELVSKFEKYAKKTSKGWIESALKET